VRRSATPGFGTTRQRRGCAARAAAALRCGSARGPGGAQEVLAEYPSVAERTKRSSTRLDSAIVSRAAPGWNCPARPRQPAVGNPCAGSHLSHTANTMASTKPTHSVGSAMPSWLVAVMPNPAGRRCRRRPAPRAAPRTAPTAPPSQHQWPGDGQLLAQLGDTPTPLSADLPKSPVSTPPIQLSTARAAAGPCRAGGAAARPARGGLYPGDHLRQVAGQQPQHKEDQHAGHSNDTKSSASLRSANTAMLWLLLRRRGQLGQVQPGTRTAGREPVNAGPQDHQVGRVDHQSLAASSEICGPPVSAGRRAPSVTAVVARRYRSAPPGCCSASSTGGWRSSRCPWPRRGRRCSGRVAPL